MYGSNFYYSGFVILYIIFSILAKVQFYTLKNQFYVPQVSSVIALGLSFVADFLYYRALLCILLLFSSSGNCRVMLRQCKVIYLMSGQSLFRLSILRNFRSHLCTLVYIIFPLFRSTSHWF